MKPVTSLDELSEDIFIEILSALSARSLHQLRCVSKKIRTLTFEPEFAKLQYDKASSNPLDISHRNFLIASDNRFRLLRSKTLARGESLSQEDFAPIDFDFQFNARENRVGITSCRGLICFPLFQGGSSVSSIYLHDTFTKQVKKVPPYDLEQALGRNLGFGFGYDSSTRDYKIVRPYSWYGFGSPPKVAIFSVRKNSWRTITYSNLKNVEPCFLRGTRNDMGVYLDGKLYWVLSRTSGSSALLCFNLETEEMEHQMVLPSHYTWDINMGVSEGCLSLWIVYYHEMWISDREHKWSESRMESMKESIWIEIWVMKKQDDGQVSWSKEGLIRRDRHPEEHLYFTPLMVSKDGQAFMLEHMVHYTDLLVYDIFSGERKEMYRFEVGNTPILHTMMYVQMETLISPYQF